MCLLLCAVFCVHAQKQDEAMLELAKQLIDCNSLMFFARGNNYATALEAALKVGRRPHQRVICVGVCERECGGGCNDSGDRAVRVCFVG